MKTTERYLVWSSQVFRLPRRSLFIASLATLWMTASLGADQLSGSSDRVQESKSSQRSNAPASVDVAKARALLAEQRALEDSVRQAERSVSSFQSGGEGGSPKQDQADKQKLRQDRLRLVELRAHVSRERQKLRASKIQAQNIQRPQSVRDRIQALVQAGELSVTSETVEAIKHDYLRQRQDYLDAIQAMDLEIEEVLYAEDPTEPAQP